MNRVPDLIGAITRANSLLKINRAWSRGNSLEKINWVVTFCTVLILKTNFNYNYYGNERMLLSTHTYLPVSPIDNVISQLVSINQI